MFILQKFLYYKKEKKSYYSNLYSIRLKQGVEHRLEWRHINVQMLSHTK